MHTLTAIRDRKKVQASKPVGYTLIELVVGMASSTLLVSGLASTLYISSQAMNLDDRPARQSSIASEVLGTMMADLRHAKSFSENTSTAVTFIVPDRNGDTKPETIRYAWSGTAGDPLTYRFNSGKVLPVAYNVQRFNFTSMTRVLLADTSPPDVVTPPVYAEMTEQKLGANVRSLALNVPAGTSVGDLLIAVVATDGDNTASLLAAAGWNMIDIGDQSGRVTMGVWWKNAAVAEPLNYTFTWSNWEQSYGWMMRFTGHDASNPINANATSVGDSPNPISPAVVSSVDKTLILRIGGFDRDDVNIDNAGLTGHTTITADYSSNTSSSISGGAGFLEQDLAGNSGTENFVLGSSQNYRTLTIAIAPNPTP